MEVRGRGGGGEGEVEQRDGGNSKGNDGRTTAVMSCFPCRFLFDNQSPAHIYYRWKLFSILQV